MSIKRRDDRDDPGTAEKTLMVVSALVVAGVFGTAVYHGATSPEEPELSVTVGKGLRQEDVVHYPVTLRNNGATGWGSVTVEVDCEPPVTVTLDNVPADGQESFTVSCKPGPAPSGRVVSRVPP